MAYESHSANTRTHIHTLPLSINTSKSLQRLTSELGHPSKAGDVNKYPPFSFVKSGTTGGDLYEEKQKQEEKSDGFT